MPTHALHKYILYYRYKMNTEKLNLINIFPFYWLISCTWHNEHDITFYILLSPQYRTYNYLLIEIMKPKYR